MTDEEKELARQLEKLKKIEKIKKGMVKDKAKRLRKKRFYCSTSSIPQMLAIYSF